jgi:CubicO group peptidase (beta-lactamase class C family)
MKRLAVALLVLVVAGTRPVLDAAPTHSLPADALDKFLQASVARGEVPGVVVAVVNREGLLYNQAFGKSSVLRNTAMTKETIFNIASMTKAVTSVAVMQLIEEGKLRLDDPVGKYVPKFKDPQVLSKFNPADASYETRPAKRPITIRHLLTHTSGIGYTFSSQTLSAIQQKTKKADYDLPLLFDPGESWAYGASTRVLGDVIVAITGQKLDEYLQAKILGPLGMNDTAYLPPPDKVARVVAVNARDNGGAFVERAAAQIQPNVAGDGGLYSTASDYARFLQMLLNGGGLGPVRILSEKTVATMFQPKTGTVVVQLQKSSNQALSRDFPVGAGEDKWGLGFQLAKTQKPDHRAPGSGTWAGIFNTHFFIDRATGIGVVVMMQTLPFYDEASMKVYDGVEEIVYRNLR